MIAEFVLNGKSVVLNFDHNPDAPTEGVAYPPICHYCGESWRKGYDPMVNPGHSWGTLLDGWVKIDDMAFSKDYSFGRMGGVPWPVDTSSAEQRQAAEYFHSLLVPRIVHRYGPCYEAWIKDDEAHPGVTIRLEHYIQARIDQSRAAKTAA